MAEAVLVKESDRLPWLAPYRAPARQKRSRLAGFAAIAAVAGAGLASLVLLPRPGVNVPQSMPQTRIELPNPVAAPIETVEPAAPFEAPQPAVTAVEAPDKAYRPTAYRPVKRRVLKAPVERLAYREVVLQQAVTAPMAMPASSDPLTAGPPPAPSDPVTMPPAPAPYIPPVVRPTPVLSTPSLVRPIVNPAAVRVRGKTVQLGAYQTARQAEIAWQRAIRDYTFLVTFPKNIQLVRYGTRGLRFYRLQLGTPSRRHARQLCSNLKSTGRTCKVA